MEVDVAEIVRHHDPDPDEDPWVEGPPPAAPVEIVDYDPAWPARYGRLAAGVRDALGPLALELAHVGSTAVPGLPAKDVIDIDLAVADPRDEDAYLPALTAAGWRHVVREPSWHEHRGLTRSEPRANLHVFGPNCPETIRHRMFRDWLRSHPEDRARYAAAKRAAIPGGGHVMDYNRRKEAVVREIYDRLFRAAGFLGGSEPYTNVGQFPDNTCTAGGSAATAGISARGRETKPRGTKAARGRRLFDAALTGRVTASPRRTKRHAWSRRTDAAARDPSRHPVGASPGPGRSDNRRSVTTA